MSNHRKAQIESLLKRATASALQRGLADPRTHGVMISVTRVELNEDLKNANVFVSVLPEQHQVRAVHALVDGTMHIQHAVKKAVALRVVPHLKFKLDKGLKKEAATLAAINEAMSRTGQPAPADEDTNTDADAPDPN